MVRKRQLRRPFSRNVPIHLSGASLYVASNLLVPSAYNTDTPNFPRALSFHAAWGNFRIPLGGYKDTHTHWALFRSLSPLGTGHSLSADSEIGFPESLALWNGHRTHAGCRNRSALCRGHIATAPAHDNLSGECVMRLSCDRDQRRRA